eukprot:GFUD01118575.1.p1 GENE.GFUD01118575.1~~GFUD01118575.1.p1  ORF type:complete len:100 (+),score=16.10 GFUD01118575.1:30-302(+)
MCTYTSSWKYSLQRHVAKTHGAETGIQNDYQEVDLGIQNDYQGVDTSFINGHEFEKNLNENHSLPAEITEDQIKIETYDHEPDDPFIFSD